MSSAQDEIVQVFVIVDVRPYETGCVKRAGILVSQDIIIKAFVGGDRNSCVKRAEILVSQDGIIKAFVGGDRNSCVKRGAGILVYRRLSCNSEVNIND